MGKFSHIIGWQQTSQQRPDKETKKDRKGKEQGKSKNNRGNTYIGIQLCYTYLGNPFRKHNDMVYVGIQPVLVT